MTKQVEGGSVSSAAVVIATYNRPEHVKICIEHVFRQTVVPSEVLVVDASPNELTRHVVEAFPGVTYARNSRGRGHTASSRRIGMQLSTSEVVAFIDDDAYADRDWLEQLLLRYGKGVGAVGGRALNGVPGEEREGLGDIGKLLDNGVLTGNFAADPGKDIDVDHLLGANMSVRRWVVDSLGGIHDHYPGTCLREETDIVLRMRKAGHRVLFTPRAVVHHVGGPYAKGRRFDTRYKYYGARNHAVLLWHTLGLRDRRTLANMRLLGMSVVRDLAAVPAVLRPTPDTTFRQRSRGAAACLVRATAHSAGLAVGTVVAARLIVLGDPRRRYLSGDG